MIKQFDLFQDMDAVMRLGNNDCPSEAHVCDVMGGENLPENYATKKLLESALKETELDLHFALSLCINNSREAFLREVHRHLDMYI
jgi:hypothetical protein